VLGALVLDADEGVDHAGAGGLELHPIKDGAVLDVLGAAGRQIEGDLGRVDGPGDKTTGQDRAGQQGFQMGTHGIQNSRRGWVRTGLRACRGNFRR
jgi:hypothetical protein